MAATGVVSLDAAKASVLSGLENISLLKEGQRRTKGVSLFLKVLGTININLSVV